MLCHIPYVQLVVNFLTIKPPFLYFGKTILYSNHYRREGGGVTRVVTRGPGALRGPVENKVCIFGYEFSISSIGRAGP